MFKEEAPRGIKLTQLTGGFLLLLAGLSFAIIALLVCLIPSTSFPAPTWIWIFVSLFLIIFIEGAIYWILNSSKIDEEKLKEIGQKNVISQIASIFALVFRYGSLIYNLIGIILILTGLGYFSYNFIIIPLQTQPIVFTWPFYIQLIGYALWFVLIRRIVVRSIYKLGKATKKNLPSYSIQSDGVLLTLKFRQGSLATFFVIIAFLSVIAAFILSKTSMKQYMIICGVIFLICFLLIIFKVGSKEINATVKINFNELDEIRVLSYVEAKSLMQYQIGPNIELVRRGIVDITNFLNKKIEKPSVYTLVHAATGANTLFLKGEKIFYLVAVENEDTNDLITAFNKFKKKK